LLGLAGTYRPSDLQPVPAGGQTGQARAGYPAELLPPKHRGASGVVT
jgi:hypothetical protein